MEKHEHEIPEIFFEETFYDWAINSYYYAVYHAALALMSKQGFTSKNHSATLAFFIYHQTLDNKDVALVANSLNREDIETLGIAKELREKSCYNIHETFEKQLAEQIREQAVEFVNNENSLLEVLRPLITASFRN